MNEVATTGGPNKVRESNTIRYALMVLVIGWLVAAGGLVATADTPENQAIKQDRNRYEGTWRVVALEVNGAKSSETDARKITVTNSADGNWAVKADGKEFWKGTSKIDPMNQPKTIDFVPTEGANAGQTSLGIYEIEGATRKLCFAPPGKDRPTEFASKPGSGHILVAFEREKK
jgi:uncharacterized protein (TIGR03067 family)